MNYIDETATEVCIYRCFRIQSKRGRYATLFIVETLGEFGSEDVAKRAVDEFLKVGGQRV